MGRKGAKGRGIGRGKEGKRKGGKVRKRDNIGKEREKVGKIGGKGRKEGYVGLQCFVDANKSVVKD